MLYPYYCTSCDQKSEVYKPMIEASREEKCESCGAALDRIWTRTHLVNAKVYEAEFNHAFGKVIHSKRQLKNEIAEINDKKGIKLVEVGNDDLSSVKRQRKEYTID